MATLWDDVKKSLGDWFSKAADRAGELTREAADKAEEVTKLGKVKLDIFQVKRELEKKFSDLGGIVYHLITQEDAKNIEKNAKITALLADVKELEQKLKKKENEESHIKQTSAEEVKDLKPESAAKKKEKKGTASKAKKK